MEPATRRIIAPHAALHAPVALLWAIAQLAPSAWQDGCSTTEAAILARLAALLAPIISSTFACNVFRDTTSTPPEDAASAHLTVPPAPHSVA